MLGYLGEKIACDDEKIRLMKRKIYENEIKKLDECEKLKEFKEYDYEEFKPYIEDTLNKHSEHFLEKKELKEKQCQALLNVLEYLNSIYSKKKEIDTEKILGKINLIEAELLRYNKFLM